MKALRQRLAVGLIVGWFLSMVSCETVHTAREGVVLPIEDAIRSDLSGLSTEQESFARALAHYANGLVCYTQGQSDEALDEWSKVVMLDVTRTDLRARMVQEYFRRGEFSKAAQFLENAIKSDPKSVVDWSLLAVALRADKQWEKSLLAAEKALSLDPGKFVGYEVLFDDAVERSDWKGAKKILDRASRQKTDEPQFWVRLAELAWGLSARDPSLGITLEQVSIWYDRAVAFQSSDVALLIRIADFFAVNRQLDKAMGLYQKILSLEPNAENVRLKLALGHVAQGEKDKAIRVLEQVVKQEPMRFQIFTMIGELYEDSKNYEQAMNHYRLSVSANPNQYLPYLKMALLELRNKKTDSALSFLDKARERSPHSSQISYFYGLAYSEKKEYDTAVRFFEEAVKWVTFPAGKKDSSKSEVTAGGDMELTESDGKITGEVPPAGEGLDAVFYFYYASAMERSGRFDQAVELFRKAIELNPDYAEACNYLGFMMAEKNIQLEEALKLIEHALSFEPENGAFLDSLGWVYYRMGRYQEALGPLLRAVSQATGNDPTVLDHVGDVYRKLGNMTEALSYYQRALKLDVKNTEIQAKVNDLLKAVSKKVD